MPFRALARQLLISLKEFEISHMLEASNQYANALATLGCSMIFHDESTSVAIVKRSTPLTEMLLKEEKEKLDPKD